MTNEEVMQEVPEGMNPMDMPAPMRVNVLINELLMMVDHLHHLRTLIDETMKELMESHTGHTSDDTTEEEE
jgi:hypothetical protein